MRKSLLAILLLSSLFGTAQNISVAKLLCEDTESPLGVEDATPSLSWQLASTGRNVMQSAYRILVADDSSLLQQGKGNIWDSHKVSSNQSLHIPFAGKNLKAAKNYFWKVQVWDNSGRPSAWSKIATWQMGLPTAKDWKGARWIAYEKLPDSLVNVLPTDGKKDTYKGSNVLPLLRTSFTATKKVKQATLFISGLGHFELSLNGKKIGDHFLDPGWTKYDKQALYVPFDVTNDVQAGENVIGVMLGNGFYYVPPVSGRYRKLKTAFGYPKMICRLSIDYTDGSHNDVVSDGSWKTAKGPITFSSIYGGEDYNANLEQEGWNKAGFSDAAWKKVMLVDGPPVLNAQMAKPQKVMETFAPQKMTALKQDQWVFDLGQNASGIPSIKVQGKKGDTIRIYPAELLKEDGSANQKASGSPYYLEYILKGNGVEEWQPRFTYYGFRYLQINGAVPKGENNSSHLPQLLDVKGLHTRNAADRAGSFTCSSDLFNKTYALIDWAIKSNMVSLFTDCPHREKLGWLEEAHLMGNSVRLNYDVANLFKKELQDIKYSQTEEGLVPEIAPEYVKFEWGNGMFRDSPEWGSTAIIIPWYLYQWYGSVDVLQKNYAVMQRYAAYLKSKAKDHILSQGLGDWYDLGPNPPGVSQLTPMGVTGTAIYYYDLNILSNIAKLLQKNSDAKAYEQEAALVKKAFNNTFFHKDTKQYATGSQTANAMAVYMNLVDPEDRQAVIENIVSDIRSRNNSLTAGDIGYRYLLRVLHEAGRDDVIYDMNSRSDVPGYGYQLAKGATALTESWAALPANSNNHFMLGHLMEWFYEGLGGIKQAENSVGYKEIVIAPRPVGTVTYANASYECPYGLIQSNWKKENGMFSLDVQIPVNTTATVVLPAERVAGIQVNGVAVNEQKGITVLTIENGKAQIKIGSGRYQFTVNENSTNKALSSN
jgi:hypothetical protein